jgi:hypothetical protein
MIGTRPHGLLYLVAAVAVAVVLVACDQPSREPARPTGLPTEAFWIGGADGGVFVRLQRPDTAHDAYSGAIYHPDGSVWYEGRFSLEPAGSAPVDAEDRQRLTGWDGTQILLDDGRALVAAEK